MQLLQSYRSCGWKLHGCSVPRFHCHPMEERNQCTHFPFWQIKHVLCFAGIFLFFASRWTSATAPCPLHCQKGMPSCQPRAQLMLMGFINEYHKLPVLFCLCTLPSVSRSPEPRNCTGQTRSTCWPAGRKGKVRISWYCCRVLTAEPPLRCTKQFVSRSARGVCGLYMAGDVQRTWEAAGTRSGLLFWGFWAGLFISQASATCCSGDCSSPG